MASFQEILMNKAQGLKQVDFKAEKAAKAAKAEELTLNNALLRHKKFVEKKTDVDEGTERAKLEELKRKEEEKREAEEREVEHQRRVADPNICVTCGKPVDKNAKDTMKAIDRFWHEDCWKCSMCRQKLSFPGDFYHVGCKLLCEKDYKMKFFCAHCGKQIIGESLQLFGKAWHRECVNERGCFGCGKPILDDEFLLACECAFHKSCLKCDKCQTLVPEQFVLVYGRPWCIKCNEKFLQENSGARKDLTRKLHQVRLFQTEPTNMICARCNKEVKAGMNAIGKIWHNECFCCDSCGKCLTYVEYFPAEDDSAAFCEDCSNEENASKCFACGKPITAEIMSILDHDYHPECFNCSLCGQPLGNEVVEQNGNPICGICSRRDRVKAGFKA